MPFLPTETGIANATTTLRLTFPPNVLDRFAEGGPAKSVAWSLIGAPIVTELASDPNDPRLVLGLEPLELDQVERLVALLDAGGPVTVKLSASSPDTETMVFAPRSQQKLVPINGHYPESDATGGPVPDLVKRWWKARVVLYRLTS